MFLLQNTDSSISIFSLNMKCTTPLLLGVFFIRLVFHARKFPILFLSAVFNLYSKPFFWPQLPGQSGERRRLDPEVLSPFESNSLWFYPRKQSFSCFFFFFLLFFASPSTRRFIADLSLFIDNIIRSLKSRGRWSGVKRLALSTFRD